VTTSEVLAFGPRDNRTCRPEVTYEYSVDGTKFMSSRINFDVGGIQSPKTIPPTNDPMKLLPPSHCENAKQDIAKATTGIPTQAPSIQPRRPQHLTRKLPMTTPTSAPIPISCSGSLKFSPSASVPSACSVANARKINNAGTQMPSFNPLSTLRLSRTDAGTQQTCGHNCKSMMRSLCRTQTATPINAGWVNDVTLANGRSVARRGQCHCQRNHG